MTDFFDFIYELFYIHIFNGPSHPTAFLMHEISLFLAYISIILLFIGVFRFFKWVMRLFGART